MHKYKQLAVVKNAILIALIALSLAACRITQISPSAITKISEPGSPSTIFMSKANETCETSKDAEDGKLNDASESKKAEKSSKPCESSDIDDAFLLARFKFLESIHTGTAGSSMQNAALTASFLNDLCVKKLDYQKLGKCFAMYLSSTKEKELTFSIKDAWQILVDIADMLLAKDELQISLAKDGGTNFALDKVKAEYWQMLKASVDNVLADT